MCGTVTFDTPSSFSAGGIGACRDGEKRNRRALANRRAGWVRNFEDAIARLRKRPEPAFRTHPALVSTTNYKPMMNNIGQNEPPREPAPELVECAIAKALELAERPGITAAAVIHMLYFALSLSFFLTAIDAA